MLLLQSLSPSPLPPLSFITRPRISQLLSHCVDNHPTCWRRRRSSASSVSTVHAVDKDSQQFEIDPDKAREALQKLDQQLQSLSQKQVSPPRKTGTSTPSSNRNFAGDQMSEEPVELSGSFLAYSALALLIFTIFYNVLFLTVIQPSIDGQ